MQPGPSLEQSGKLTRVLTIMAGAVISALALAGLFWLISYFVPRFLRASGDGRVRFIMIGLATALLFFNFLNRRRRRRR